MNQVADLNEPRDEAQYFRVVEAKAIMIHKTKQVVYLPVKCVRPSEESPDEFWLNLMPSRYRSIAKMLSAHIDAEKKGKKGTSFEKGSTGAKFIRSLRKRRDRAISAKFETKGRFKSRKKANRAAQLAADMIDVPMPSVAGVGGISLQMKLATSKKNGRAPLWMCVNPKVIDFLALSLEHYEARDSDDEDTEDREDSSDNENVAMSGASEPEAVPPSSPPRADGDQPSPIAAQVSTPGPQAAAVSDGASETPSPVAKSAFEKSPIFKAFQKASTSH